MRFIHVELLNKYCEVFDFKLLVHEVDILLKLLNYILLTFEENKSNEMLKINTWINLLFFDQSDMFRPLNRSHHLGF
jgi:hypothetical protein